MIALSADKALPAHRMKHGVSKKPIGSSLITPATGFEPLDDVGIQTHSDRLFHRPIEFAYFGSGPIEHRRGVGKVNVGVPLCGDGGDVPLLLPRELAHRLSFHGTRPHEPR